MATMTLTADHDKNRKPVFFVDGKQISEEEFYELKRNATSNVAHLPELKKGGNLHSIYGWKHHYIVTGAAYQESSNV